MKLPPRVKLVSPTSAAKILAGPARVVPVDSTWYMPNAPLQAHDQYLNDDRVPGAVFFDLDKVCDAGSSYPHMLPKQSVFNDAVARLGISPSDSVLIYDRTGIFSGPRAAWTFALYGHENVFLLDHYREFKNQFAVDTRKLETSSKPSPSTYAGISEHAFSQQYGAQVIEFEELAELVKSGELTERYHVIDARSSGRFTGKDPEPRPGLSSGHVPGAVSLPFPRVLDENGHYKSERELVKIIKDLGIDLEQPLQKEGIIVMCGTGVTAVILQLAIQKVSPTTPIRVYDGSWTEWAQRAPDLIEKSEA